MKITLYLSDNRRFGIERGVTRIGGAQGAAIVELDKPLSPGKRAIVQEFGGTVYPDGMKFVIPTIRAEVEPEV